MAKSRKDRREAIRRIVRSRSVTTQRDLVLALQREGFSCTQATVSRDVADMRLAKPSGGAYVLEEDLHLRQMVATLVLSITNVDNLVVIKSQTGTANGVCAALDNAMLPHVVGTIAGDDTILVILDTETAAKQFVNTLNSCLH